MPLIECVPNFSEGRRPEVIAAIRDAIATVKDVVILDVSSDPSHNRTVVTFVAPVATAADAAFAGVAKAAELIDLNQHEGEHPRLGATDVCPFIPLEGASMDPKETPDQQAVRESAIQTGLMKASEVPLDTARWCGEVA